MLRRTLSTLGRIGVNACYVAKAKGLAWGTYALPYAQAMTSFASIDDNYGMDTCRDIVIRFLYNTAQWRGQEAREVKAELKQYLDR